MVFGKKKNLRKYSQIIFKLLNPIFRVPMCSWAYILKTERERERERESVREIKRKHPPILSDTLLEKYANLINSIELILENQCSLKKFPNELKNEIITGIGFQDIEIGKFTFFNAFFLDNYNYTQIF